MTTFSICIVAEQVKEHNRFKELFIFLGETEVMIFEIIFNKLLKRTCAIRTVVTECGEWDNVKAKVLTYNVRGDFAPRERVLREIPPGSLTTRRFVHG